jgi:transcriptional regulator with XRE-family HTH domain
MPKQQQARDDQAIWRDFGDMLQRLRLDQGLTVPKLVEMTGNQVSRDQIHKLEHGGYRKEAGGPWETPNPRDDKLAALAKALAVRIEDWYAIVGRYDQRSRTRQHKPTGGAARRSDAERIAALEEEVRQIRERNERLEAQHRRTLEVLHAKGVEVPGEDGGRSGGSGGPRRRRSPS